MRRAKEDRMGEGGKRSNLSLMRSQRSKTPLAMGEERRRKIERGNGWMWGGGRFTYFFWRSTPYFSQEVKGKVTSINITVRSRVRLRRLCRRHKHRLHVIPCLFCMSVTVCKKLFVCMNIFWTKYRQANEKNRYLIAKKRCPCSVSEHKA